MNRKLLIVSPARGGLPTFYFHLFERLIRKGIQGWDIDYVVESNNAILNISRNILANEAVANSRNYDRMLMLDTDMVMEEEHVARILSHDHDAVPIVSPLYCMKKPGKPFFLGIRAKGSQPDANMLLEAEFLPTGGLSMSTDALRQMQAHHKEREFYVHDDHVLLPGPRPAQKTMFELFPYGVRGPRTAEARMRRIKNILKPGRIIPEGTEKEVLGEIMTALTDEQPAGNLLGEDYACSRLAKEAGIKQYIDLACVVPHMGSIPYPITDPNAVATVCDQIPEAAADSSNW